MANGESWRDLPPEELIAYLDQCSPEERELVHSRILVQTKVTLVDHIKTQEVQFKKFEDLLNAWNLASGTSIFLRWMAKVFLGLAAVGSALYGAYQFIIHGGHPPH